MFRLSPLPLSRVPRTFRLIVLSLLTWLFSFGFSGTTQAAPVDSIADGPSSSLRIDMLSSSPQYVSGGTALLQITTALSTKPSFRSTKRTAAAVPLRIQLNGHDIPNTFKAAIPSGQATVQTGLANGTISGTISDPVSDPISGLLMGLVTGLRDGSNTISVLSGETKASLQLTNYPITGPIISGPLLRPFICETQHFALPDGSMLGPATDANCSANTRITYLYMPIRGGAFKPLPLDPKAGATAPLPADTAMTTTTTGMRVPFVVRVETGTIDRGIYQIAVLHDPDRDASPVLSPATTPRAWNRRLLAIEGFGCTGGWYVQGAALGNTQSAGFNFSTLDPKRLGEGYATFSNTLQHASNSCNPVLAAEAAMMTKEYFVKTFGVPDFTVSAGCSGGSYGSLQPADLIPRLFDGVLIACTFPDALSLAFSGSDAHLLTHYFGTTNPTGFSPAQQLAISGYKTQTAFHDAANQAARTDPVSGRHDQPGYTAGRWLAAVPVALRYDPTRAPAGARADLYDWNRNVYGVDPATGFARRPYDNVGVQFGLNALDNGLITPDQFIDLNEKIGGYDNDANYLSSRSSGDPDAIRRMYQSGTQLAGNGGLASIPVVDITGSYNEDGGYHYQWTHFATRERLKQANGNADNHVMWRGNSIPPSQAWSMFIQWVRDYKADHAKAGDALPSPVSLAAFRREKMLRHKPLQAVDGCWRDSTHFIAEAQTLSSQPDSTCNRLYPAWTAPRIQAGGPIAADIIKCRLKPVRRQDYKVPLSDAQLDRLQHVFPEGVCNWQEKGQRQNGVMPMASLGPSPVNRIVDDTRQGDSR